MQQSALSCALFDRLPTATEETKKEKKKLPNLLKKNKVTVGWPTVFSHAVLMPSAFTFTRVHSPFGPPSRRLSVSSLFRRVCHVDRATTLELAPLYAARRSQDRPPCLSVLVADGGGGSDT